jgi:hypothetical protein
MWIFGWFRDYEDVNEPSGSRRIGISTPSGLIQGRETALTSRLQSFKKEKEALTQAKTPNQSAGSNLKAGCRGESHRFTLTTSLE